MPAGELMAFEGRDNSHAPRSLACAWHQDARTASVREIDTAWRRHVAARRNEGS